MRVSSALPTLVAVMVVLYAAVLRAAGPATAPALITVASSPPDTQPATVRAACEATLREIVRAERAGDMAAMERCIVLGDELEPVVQKQIRTLLQVSMDIEALRAACRERFGPGEHLLDRMQTASDVFSRVAAVLPAAPIAVTGHLADVHPVLPTEQEQYWRPGAVMVFRYADGRWRMDIAETYEINIRAVPRDAATDADQLCLAMLGDLHQMFCALSADVRAGRFAAQADVAAACEKRSAAIEARAQSFRTSLDPR